MSKSNEGLSDLDLLLVGYRDRSFEIVKLVLSIYEFLENVETLYDEDNDIYLDFDFVSNLFVQIKDCCDKSIKICEEVFKNA